MFIVKKTPHPPNPQKSTLHKSFSVSNGYDPIHQIQIHILIYI